MQKEEVYQVMLTEFDEEKYEAMVRNDERIKTFCILVAKKTITLKKTLEECNLTEREFLNERIWLDK